MEPYKIKSPKWNGGRYEVGLATFRVPAGGKARIRIGYKNRDGDEIRPGIYEMDAEKLRTYPIQDIGKGVKVYLSPLNDWEHKYE